MRNILLLVGFGIVFSLFGAYEWNQSSLDMDFCEDYYRQYGNTRAFNVNTCHSEAVDRGSRGGLFFVFGIALIFGGFIVFSRRKKATSATTDTAPINNSPSTNSTPTNTDPDTNTDKVKAEIQKAKDMLDEGLIDEEEFKLMKQKIIDNSLS